MIGRTLGEFPSLANTWKRQICSKISIALVSVTRPKPVSVCAHANVQGEPTGAPSGLSCCKEFQVLGKLYNTRSLEFLLQMKSPLEFLSLSSRMTGGAWKRSPGLILVYGYSSRPGP